MSSAHKTKPCEFEQDAVIGEKYRVVRRLGVGGMGAVYEAENTWTGRRVAVKVLLPSAAGRNDLEERFMQEAQAVARLRHPNIVDVIDMGRDGATGVLFMVQEHLEGKDLFDHLAIHGPMGARESLELMVPIMGALIAAHERGILHRDIKPENIFLQKGKGGEKVPKLIDFGVAKILSGARVTRQTASGLVVGTVNYMSPEQSRGEPTLDARSDVYAVGVVLYEMLSGVLPQDGSGTDTLGANGATHALRPLSERVPELPDSVCALVHRALASDLASRFQSVREMLDATLACEVFANDPPEKSLRMRHMRSLPTYSAQLRPATPGAPAPKAVPVAPSLARSSMDRLIDSTFLAMGLDPADPNASTAPPPQQPPAHVAPAPLAPVQVAPVVEVHAPEGVSAPPHSYPARKLTHYTDAQRFERSAWVAVKLAAAFVAVTGVASVAIVWRAQHGGAPVSAQLRQAKNSRTNEARDSASIFCITRLR